MRDEAKKRAAERAVEYVEEGQVVGLGTGSTTRFAIEAIGRRVKEGLRITGVPTSKDSDALARELGIPLVDLNDIEKIDITIDGSDEIDSRFDMIKGGGGAMTREKLVALASRTRIIVVDEPKLVSSLGQTRPLPVEVLPFAWRMSARCLSELGCKPVLRSSGEAAFVTDNGNYILDCEFGPIEDPPSMEKRIKLIPGVVESGLFIAIADSVIIAFDDRVEVRSRPA
ncbi:MAG TPA: ribose-5-phosphate isomerase RpiA [Blastocatellia bacterium]|nr:ribose-5-phosphate isomerase RpiA [Blastocatellia bacterium]